jgi:tetratricopeptide (TPR) repeat protein/cold shock CspA family protein
LQEWGAEHPLIFIGHSVQDADIRSVLRELQDLGDFRPRYFIVAPGADEIKARFWGTKKITLLGGTFEEFLTTLDGKISPAFRALAISKPTVRHAIEQHSQTNAPLSESTVQFLNVDVQYVNGISATPSIDPEDFYKGHSGGFAAVEKQLDVRRRLGDELAVEYLIRDQYERTAGPEVVLIKAHAGAGKSVILHRLAWDGSRDYECICLFAKPQGALLAAPLQEIIRNLRRRVYLFIDDAADRTREIEALLKRIGAEGDYLTLVIAERINEWNVHGQGAAPFVTEEYELKYLIPTEIDSLLTLLEQHHALGTRLEKLNLDERRKELSEHAGRQLLVALHEANLGIPFESILVDEFNKITPFEAQGLYLTVCVLNRLNVPVRAGLVARVHGIPFDEFKERFFKPLEHVVFAQRDEITRDYHYRARHPHIADIVFLRVLKSDEDRFDCYIRAFKALNVSYSTDWKAFWQMVRSRNLIELFPDVQMVKAVFSTAREIVGEDPHLLHQMGIYEMNRQGGDLAEALRLLSKASDLAHYDSSIQHSIAEQKLKAADQSRTHLERSKLLRETANISAGLIRGEKTDSYAHHTLVKVRIRELEDVLAAGASEAEIESSVKNAESTLFEAQQEFPGDSHLLEAESQLAEVLKDNDRATSALTKAFNANPRNGFVAARLARQLENSGKIDKAAETLRKALDANGTDRRLHYGYARLLMRTAPSEGDQIAYHLQRAFTDGDNNHEARLLYGRQLFINGGLDESRAQFRLLSKTRVAPDIKNRLLYPIEGRRFEGRMSRPQGTFAFVTREGPGDSIYVHATNVPNDTWEILTMGMRVRFSIAFSLRGANAFDLEII